jgi:diacylglycerol O-acyltransferase
MQRLTALDTGFLQLEDQHVALHIGATAVFDGPPPTHEEVKDRYRAVTAVFPRFRQRLQRTPFDLRRPVWVDTDVDLDGQVRRAALPAPGGPDELERLIGRIMTYRLDPDRPLWEAWLIEGLADGRWALLTKIHHSVVDGVGGMIVFAGLLDGGSAEAAVPLPRVSRPRRRRWPGPVALALGTLHTLDGTARYLASLRPTPATSLIGPLSSPRRYRTLTVEMADVRRIRQAFGGTVNDVVLTMVTRGFHGLLLHRNEAPVPHAIRCMVPVSVRAAGGEHEGTNRVTVMFLDLPVEFGDVESAFEAVLQRTARLKSSGERAAGARGFALADMLPGPVAAAAMALVRRFPQRVLTTVATNVPGPQDSNRTMFGRPLLAIYPYVPIAERLRLGVAITSYNDRLYLGVTCDRVSVPDADVFVTAMAAALMDLVKDADRRLAG